MTDFARLSLVGKMKALVALRNQEIDSSASTWPACTRSMCHCGTCGDLEEFIRECEADGWDAPAPSPSPSPSPAPSRPVRTQKRDAATEVLARRLAQ
jgi:hypothetical protein